MSYPFVFSKNHSPLYLKGSRLSVFINALLLSGAYSALIDHVFAWNVDQRFAADRSSGGLNFSTAF